MSVEKYLYDDNSHIYMRILTILLIILIILIIIWKPLTIALWKTWGISL